MKKLACTFLLFTVACGTSDDDYKSQVTSAMHTSIGKNLADLAQAARDLQTAAPTHQWSMTTDAAAITAMKAAWKKARVAYELVEGATAPIFPDQDFAMDARYDDYMLELGPAGDSNLFDKAGATGMHSIERILFAPDIRDEVIDFEADLPGYKAAAWPTNDTEAMAFKTELVQQLIDDADDLHAQWQPAAIDIGAAFNGLIGLMNEQREKVNLAATGEEESRYANITLFDLRNNLAGTRAVYELFRDWIADRDGGDADARIQAKFDELDALYKATAGDALPPVPTTWSSDMPSAADLATPFGMMWKKVQDATNPALEDSIVSDMNEIANLLGFPQFVEE